MATDTAPKKTEATPADSSKDTTPAKAAAKPESKPKPQPRAKTAAKSRTRSTAASSRSRTATKSRSRKTAAARTARAATATAKSPAQAKALNGGQQLVAGVIDAQEKSVTAMVDYQTRAAELSQIPGVTTVAQVQAKLLRSVTQTYANAARALLK